MQKLKSAGKETTLFSSEWLSLEETMEKLGRSRATLERMVLSGTLASKLSSRPGRKSERLYSAADVTRLTANAKLGSYHGPARPAPGGTVKKLTDGNSANSTSLEVTASKREEEQERQHFRVPLMQKLWLSIDEAAAYSGFGESFLKTQIAQEKVLALKAGPNGSWVIERISLERFKGG